MRIRIVLKSGYAIDTEVDDYGQDGSIWYFENSLPAVSLSLDQVAAVVEFEDEKPVVEHPFGFDKLHNHTKTP